METHFPLWTEELPSDPVERVHAQLDRILDRIEQINAYLRDEKSKLEEAERLERIRQGAGG
jgi:hypothetical protein